ncbi:immunoglobulin superfamily member 6 [Limanda limanda]|uniref:immunoglobulin superfamily member 6 n=1 Tax=Limanda limanda TaxID=27771 RepID=UPI0029C7694C|nr:immunoglobulin superfamily member 6 [Limanda limanda]
MRSPTSVQATDMDWLLCFSLMLTHLLLTDSSEKTEISVTQRQRPIWRKTGQKVVLPCTVSSDSSSGSIHYMWFVFKENSHFPIKLISPKYSLDGASLDIKPLNINDSGIYYCAAQTSGNPAKDSQHVGTGTVLTVTGHVKTLTMHILLWSSLVLLVIYSTAIVTLIILKKHGCNMTCCRRRGKIDKKNESTKKTRFRNVLQEMNNRRNLERSEHASGQSGLQVEPASPEINISTDDIYQNVI